MQLRPNSNLLLFLSMILAISVLSFGQAFACSNPMSESQLKKVISEFQSMTPSGDGFKIDRCRNITITYGSYVRKGKLHQLFTTLNHSHHDTTYFGLINDGEWWVGSSTGGVYIYDPDKTKQQSANWMIDMNARTVRLLKLAGYDSDPQAAKRAEILQRDLEELGTPDFGQVVGGLLSVMSQYAPSGHQSISKNQCEATKKSCLAQCQGLSSGDPIWGLGGPRARCKDQCNRISCY